MDAYLSVLVKRLRPDADEINAVSKTEGWCKAGWISLPYPTPAEFDAEWALLQSELPSNPPPEPTVVDLQARLNLIEDALIELIAGGL